MLPRSLVRKPRAARVATLAVFATALPLGLAVGELGSATAPATATAPAAAAIPAPAPAPVSKATDPGAAPTGATPAAATPAPAPRDPGDEWQTAPLDSAGFDAVRFQAVVDYLFPQTTPAIEAQRQGIRTDALVIIKGGKLVFERYAHGYQADSRHYGWSMTKTVLAALVGIAEKEGRLRRDAAVTDLVKPLAGRPQLAGLTVAHLLQMSSGLAWAETYEYSPLKSTVIAMLYTAGFRDMAAYVAAQPREAPPGSRYRYSSGDTNLLSSVLKAALPKAEYDDYPFTRLFVPLGMRSAVFEQDESGTYVGSSYLHATARDFARFGYLYLRRGVYNGVALVPAEFIEFSTKMAPAFYQTALAADEKDENPGASLWLNLGDPTRQLPPPWPDAPPDTFAALGHWGQSIFIIPSHDLVAVRLADDRDGSFSKNHYLKLLLSSESAAASQGGR